MGMALKLLQLSCIITYIYNLYATHSSYTVYHSVFKLLIYNNTLYIEARCCGLFVHSLHSSTWPVNNLHMHLLCAVIAAYCHVCMNANNV